MLIECTQHRPGGSHVEMADGTVLHFAPGKDGRHVCEVESREHAGRLLSIAEAYRLADESPQLALDEPQDDSGEDAPRRRSRKTTVTE